MRALLLSGLVIGSVLVVAACSPPTPAGCSAATCAGCCDSTGACQPGTEALACGGAGKVCMVCSAGCQGKVCTSGTGGGAGGGSVGGGGGSTGGGGGATGGGGGITGGGGGATGGGGGAAASCQSVTAPMIPITFPTTCPSPTPCGGNPSGTFLYSAACIPRSEFDSLVSQIEGAGCGAGTVTISGIDGGMSGYATFTGATVCRVVRGAVTVNASVTGLCANPTVCGVLGGGISQRGYTGSCSVSGAACACTVSKEIRIDNSGVAYTVGATTLSVTSTGQTFETCLSGATFSTRELDAGTAPHEPGVATLTHQ